MRPGGGEREIGCGDMGGGKEREGGMGEGGRGKGRVEMGDEGWGACI